MFGIHPDLRTYISTTVYVAVALASAGATGFIYGLTGHHRQWPFVIFGILALLSSLAGILVVPRWYRHATGVVSAVTPRSGHVRLEIESSSESPSLYVTLIDGAEPQSRGLLLMPSWPVQPLLGGRIEVGIYFDPASHLPVAFNTSSGLLWCVPRWQGAA